MRDEKEKEEVIGALEQQECKEEQPKIEWKKI